MAKSLTVPRRKEVIVRGYAYIPPEQGGMMGIFRMKKKDGTYYDVWYIQYPVKIDPKTGKTVYTTKKAGLLRRWPRKCWIRSWHSGEKRSASGSATQQTRLFPNWSTGTSAFPARKLNDHTVKTWNEQKSSESTSVNTRRG